MGSRTPKMMGQRRVDERHLAAAHDDGGVDEGVRLVVGLVKTPRLGSEAGPEDIRACSDQGREQARWWGAAQAVSVARQCPLR